MSIELLNPYDRLIRQWSREPRKNALVFAPYRGTAPIPSRFLREYCNRHVERFLEAGAENFIFLFPYRNNDHKFLTAVKRAVAACHRNSPIRLYGLHLGYGSDVDFYVDELDAVAKPKEALQSRQFSKLIVPAVGWLLCCVDTVRPTYYERAASAKGVPVHNLYADYVAQYKAGPLHPLFGEDLRSALLYEKLTRGLPRSLVANIGRLLRAMTKKEVPSC